MVNNAVTTLSPTEKKLKAKRIRAKVIAQFIIWTVLVIMYIPILVLIAYSFTKATNIGTWTGFSFGLYSDLFHDEEIMTALGNTLICNPSRRRD